MTTAASTNADGNLEFHEEHPVKQIHTHQISWQAMLKLAIFCIAVTAFIHGLGQTPAQSATYLINTYDPAIAQPDDARNLYLANMVLEITQSNGNIALIAGPILFIIVLTMLYWMTVSFNLAQVADALIHKIPMFSFSATTATHRAPRRDPLNYSMARKISHVGPKFQPIVSLANRYHFSFHPGDNRKLVKIILFSIAVGALFAGTGDMLFNAAEYDIRNQGGHHWTSYLATLNDGDANLALLAGSIAFIGIIIVRIMYFIFVNLVYYAVMGTFGAVLATANTINREHERWLEYQQTLNDPEQSDIPNLPGNHAAADADQTAEQPADPPADPPADQADDNRSPSTEPQPATT